MARLILFAIIAIALAILIGYLTRYDRCAWNLWHYLTFWKDWCMPPVILPH